MKNGYFTKEPGSAGTVKTSVFTSGTRETTAILSGQIDAAYVGPNPTINAWQKSGGTAIKIVSGAATGGGDVSIKPTNPNSAAVLEFQSGQIAGASEPAPYDIEMVKDGGKVLLSEPGVTTVLMVTQSFLSAHPDIVSDLLKANLDALNYIKTDPSGAEAAANAELAAYTGKPLKSAVLDPAFKEITFTADPDAASLNADANNAVSLGLLKPVNLSGIFDLTALNSLLGAAGQASVSG